MLSFQSVRNRLTHSLSITNAFLFIVTSICIAGEPLRGKALRPGDTIMVVAPAKTPSKTNIMLAKRRLEAMGFNMRVPADLFEQNGYLAGSDSRRVAEIMRAFKDPEVDAICAATGGFGTTRILDLLDYEVIKNNPKVLTGFSDITALHLAINKMTSLITFHGPNLDSGLGLDRNLTSFSSKWFFRAVRGPLQVDARKFDDEKERPGIGYVIRAFDFSHDGLQFDQSAFSSTCELEPPISMNAGKATGRITGGNLTLIAALMGTPYEIDTKDAVLFLEDIGEAPYRVDRMLSTLKLAGKIDQAAAIVLGAFTYRADQDTSNEGQTIDEVLDSYFLNIGKPVIKGFPFGHHVCNATLPIGAKCEVDTFRQTLRILEEPVTVD